MKKLVLLATAFAMTASVNAQYRWDAGIKFGGANYLGEMGGKFESRRDFIWDMKLEQTSFAVGAFARYTYSPRIAFNVGFMYGRIQGDDKLSSNPGRVGRNQNFRNDIIELYGRTEIYFYRNYDVGGAYRYICDFGAYAFTGVAAYRSNPMGQLEGSDEWVPLAPLQTEGVDYSQWGLSLPTGMGCYFTFDSKHRLGFEMGWRLTFDDYLDDVSGYYVSDAEYATMDPLAQAFSNRRPELGNDPYLPEANNYGDGNKRGDPSHNDTYLFGTITYSVTLGHDKFSRQKYPWFLGWLFGKEYVRKNRSRW